MLDLKFFKHHGVYAKYGFTSYLCVPLATLRSADREYINSLELAFVRALGIFGEKYVIPPNHRWISDIIGRYDEGLDQRWYFKTEDVDLIKSIIIEHKLTW